MYTNKQVPPIGALITVTHVYNGALITDVGTITNQEITVRDDGAHVTGLELELTEDAGAVIAPADVIEWSFVK